MLANWVKESTLTTGTGTITLGGAEAGYIPFSAAFRSGDSVVYEITDGNNREIGNGTVVAGTPWTLVRSRVIETLVSGTYTRLGTAISLSGTAKVSVAATADSFVHNRFPPYQVAGTRYMHPYAGEGANYAPGANILYVHPFYNRLPATVVSMISSVQTAGAAATKYRLGIYGDSPEGAMMGQLIAQTGDIDAATTGTKDTALTSSVYLASGWYLLGVLANDATLRLRGSTFVDHSTPSQASGSVDAGSYVRNRGGWRRALSAGWTELPADPNPASLWDFTSVPLFVLKS